MRFGIPVNKLSFRLKWILVFTILIIVSLIVLLLTLNSVNKSKFDETRFYDRVIRLHIIANSDLSEDQDVKRKVRDRILNDFGSQMLTNDSINNAEEMIEKKIPEIEKVALDELNKNGKPMAVKAVLGNFQFPVRTYGDVVFPNGEYKALRVILGEGKGANWWCVIFPPLCFVDATHGAISQDMKDELNRYLSADDIKKGDWKNANPPVKFKFKILEIMNATKKNLSNSLHALFN